MLKRLLGGQRINGHEVAKELGTGSRTWRRQITEEGSSFRQLLVTRVERATAHG
jgi:hypothetical protein